nr:hypothetical protein BaRGS_034558 [Batillaria attramentaria]
MMSENHVKDKKRVMSFFMGDNAPSWAVPDLPENERKTASAQDVQKPFKETTLEKYRSRVLKERAKEKAFVRSLLVVFLLMVFCFLPFGITLIVMIYDADRPLSPEAYISCVLLLFFSSSVNWIVYGLMNRSFRHAYFKLVRPSLRLGIACGGVKGPRFASRQG